MILGFFVFEEDEPSTEEDKRVDWIGAALITVGLVLIVFVLSDSPVARKGWKNPREFSSTSASFSNSSRLDGVRRRHRPIRRWRPARRSLRRLAALLGAAAREPGSSAHALDGTATHETINVDACARSLRGDADHRVHQLGGIHDLDSVGGAVLPNVPEPEPDPHDAAPAADVHLGHRRERPDRAHDRAHRRHVHRRHGHAVRTSCSP